MKMAESVGEATAKLPAANKKVEKALTVTKDRIELEFSQNGIHDNTKEPSKIIGQKKNEIVLEVVNPNDFSSESDDRSSTESELDGNYFKEGLHALNQITTNTHKVIEFINNSSCQPKRMVTSPTEVPDPKRRKIDLKCSSKSDENLNQIRQNVTKFTKKELEELVTRHISEVLSSRSEISELRRRCDLYEEENEKWKKKQILLQKMTTDLTTVMKKYILDKQENPKDEVKPVKITRHVGLQISDRKRSSLTKTSSTAKIESPLEKTAPSKPPVPSNSKSNSCLVHPVPLPEKLKSKEDQDPNLKPLPPKPTLQIIINKSGKNFQGALLENRVFREHYFFYRSYFILENELQRGPI